MDDLPAACVVCQKTLLSDDEGTAEPEPIRMCGDCNFLFLEEPRSPVQGSHRRRPPRRRRRTRYSSSESTENPLSQQSHMISLVRQNQSSVSVHDDQHLVDGDAGPSSRTTPTGSRRWRRVLSDTESDGFDNLDSVYGETESNVSYGGYRLFNGESEEVSFSAYGGDSDASVDGNGFLDVEMFVQPDEDGSNLNSDSDIDPMHARIRLWNSNDHDDDDDEHDDEDEEDEEEDEDGEWEEEADHEENGNVVESAESEAHPLDEFEVLPYFGNSEDYLDVRGFEEFLENLAETDGSRRSGAPPAAVSFVNGLPRVAITGDHEEHGDGLVCAICKECLSVGTEANQLPCCHLYHPPCIRPWLAERNSCPLCRYELPTDDKDYEEGKMTTNSTVPVPEIAQGDYSGDDDSSDEGIIVNSPSAGPEGGRRRWFFLAAAAPTIVGLVGMAIAMWFQNPVTERRGGGIDHSTLHRQTRIHGSGSVSGSVSGSGSGLVNQRESQSRRWWSLF